MRQQVREEKSYDSLTVNVVWNSD